MTTANTCELSDLVNEFRRSATDALARKSVEGWERFEKQIGELETSLRELQQSLWADEVRQAVRRLEKGDALTEADVEVIRTFLVSDAEHYLAMENNYQDWVDEFQRLADDIARRVEGLDRDSIGELRGVLKDARRLVPDIRNYLEEQARVERFNVALHTFDAASRAALARVLKEQLTSRTR